VGSALLRKLAETQSPSGIRAWVRDFKSVLRAGG